LPTELPPELTPEGAHYEGSPNYTMQWTFPIALKEAARFAVATLRRAYGAATTASLRYIAFASERYPSPTFPNCRSRASTVDAHDAGAPADVPHTLSGTPATPPLTTARSRCAGLSEMPMKVPHSSRRSTDTRTCVTPLYGDFAANSFAHDHSELAPSHIIAGPALTWSYSRAALLDRCERLYYEHYYGSSCGWYPGADPRTRLSYRLKQLQTPSGVLGHALHRRAVEVALAIRAGERTPTLDEMTARTAAELRAIVFRTPRDATWTRDPRRAPILHEAFYGPMAPHRRSSLLAELLTRARSLHQALLDSPVWRVVAQPGAALLFVEETIIGNVDGVPAMATPDLVLRTPEGRVLIVEWKTGQTADRRQVAWYAQAVQHSLGAPTHEAMDAWIVHLDRACLEPMTISVAELEHFMSWQCTSAKRMRELLADPSRHEPLPRHAFRQSAVPNTQCRSCKMLAVCRAELLETAHVA